MILRTPMPLRVSTFCMASIWNTYSLPDPPRRIAGAHLRGAQHGEVHPGALHELGHGAGDPTVLVVVAAGAAHPVEVLGLDGTAAVEHDDALEVAGPVGAGGLGHAPRVAGVLHRAVGGAEFGGEVALHEREVAPHVQDLVQDLDVHRADLVARLAGGAGPDSPRSRPVRTRSPPVTVISASWPMGGEVAGVPLAAMTWPTFSTISRGSSGLPVACAGHHRRAAPAHRAGVEVHELLPGEVLHHRGRRRCPGRSP